MNGTQRCRIEFGLAAEESARSIAKEIGVSLSTVTREVGKHTYESFKGCYGRTNQCVHRQDCKLSGVCADCPAKGAPCARCSYRNCNRSCDKVEYIDCPKRLLRTCKVCNGCPAGMREPTPLRTMKPAMGNSPHQYHNPDRPPGVKAIRLHPERDVFLVCLTPDKCHAGRLGCPVHDFRLPRP